MWRAGYPQAGHTKRGLWRWYSYRGGVVTPRVRTASGPHSGLTHLVIRAGRRPLSGWVVLRHHRYVVRQYLCSCVDRGERSRPLRRWHQACPQTLIFGHVFGRPNNRPKATHSSPRQYTSGVSEVRACTYRPPHFQANHTGGVAERGGAATKLTD